MPCRRSATRGVGGGEVLLLGAIDDGGERVVEEGDQDGAGLVRIALEDRLSEGDDEGADDIPVERVLRMLAEPTDLRPEAVDDDGARGVALDARETRRGRTKCDPEADDVAVLHRCRHLPGELGEVRGVVVLDPRHHMTHRADPDVAEEVDGIADLIQIDRRDPGVAVALHLDEAVVGQAVEGMADRGLRGAEAFRELVVAQPLSRTQLAADDRFLQPVVRFIAHRPAFEGST